MSTLQLDIVHSSLDTFMSDEKNKEDVHNLLDMNAVAYALTETGQVSTVRLIDEVCKKRRTHRMINPDVGDITFMLHKDAQLLHFGGDVVIPTEHGLAAEGAHGPRCNSYLMFGYEGENFGYSAFHAVTLHALPKHGGPLRTAQQVKQAEAFAQQMQKFGKGRGLALGSCDLNARLPDNEHIQAVMDEYGITTTAEETRVMTPTHGDTRIDYMFTYDRDKRLSVPEMKVYRGPRFNSDHDPIRCTIAVKQ